MARRAMIHNNSEIIAAIAIQTTGPRPRFHDLIQVCVLPLDSTLRPIKGIIPFYMEMLPKRPDNAEYKEMAIPRLDYFKLLQRAMDSDRLADMFDEWYDKIQLKPGKKLIPLCYDWGRVYSFMEDWLDYNHMKHYFSNEVRDVLGLCMYDNDKADAHVEQIPYPKHESLSNLCWRHGIDNKRSYDPMGDASALAGLYKRMLSVGHFNPVGSYIEQHEKEEPEPLPELRPDDGDCSD